MTLMKRFEKKRHDIRENVLAFGVTDDQKGIWSFQTQQRCIRTGEDWRKATSLNLVLLVAMAFGKCKNV